MPRTLNHAVPLRPCSGRPRQRASADATESAAAETSPSRSAARVSASSSRTQLHRRARPSGRTRRRPNYRRLSERGAKAGDVMVERVPRSRRELFPPEASTSESTLTIRPLWSGASPQGQALGAAHVPRPSRRQESRKGEKPDLKQLLHMRRASSDESRTVSAGIQEPCGWHWDWHRARAVSFLPRRRRREER